ncbi:MAG: sigma-70 family RNA polymerase sigma factor [Planctomycetes bacterium]|nr:sigma-70 family RNA polymerase sigma factor [Planctomycetota bacterium]
MHPVPTPAPDTRALLARWHAGDTSALAELVELHLPWLQQHVRGRLGDFLARHAEPQDYLQDAVLDFLRYAPRFVVRDEKQFRGLLVRVVENTLLDRNEWFRAKRRDMARNGPLPTDSVLALDPAFQRSETPSREVAAREQRDWVRLGLEVLPAADRRILVLREWEDRSFAEIGAELGLTEAAARMRWVRAVGRLAAVLRDLRQGIVPAAGQGDPQS